MTRLPIGGRSILRIDLRCLGRRLVVLLLDLVNDLDDVVVRHHGWLLPTQEHLDEHQQYGDPRRNRGTTRRQDCVDSATKRWGLLLDRLGQLPLDLLDIRAILRDLAFGPLQSRLQTTKLRLARETVRTQRGVVPRTRADIERVDSPDAPTTDRAIHRHPRETRATKSEERVIDVHPSIHRTLSHQSHAPHRSELHSAAPEQTTRRQP